jgi:hypothetical protein
MDTIILGASLLSFLALIASWLALPSSSNESATLPIGAPVRA